ncbi:MAG: YdcF family protein [Acidobacteriales bacterium]|nr:YdcF family protein [Terriglobales bacterium]
MRVAAVKVRDPGNWPLPLLVLAAIFLLYICSISARIVGAASLQQDQPADAIVVFGAAEYSGRPSPVYRARLDHAFELFRRGLAPVVITTGGAAADPTFSEGGVGHDYLMHRGISEPDLIAETQGSDTAQSAKRVGAILRENHMHTCLVVSDAYHVFRIRKLLEHEGIQVFVTPRPESRPHSVGQKLWALLRESASYILWQLGIPA